MKKGKINILWITCLVILIGCSRENGIEVDEPTIPPDTVPSQSDFESASAINRKLGRGINYGHLFEGPPGITTVWKETQWNPEYAGIIAGLGFKHVRIPIRWEREDRSMSTPPYTIDTAFLDFIKQVVDLALNNGLYAIIDMHNHNALMDNPDGQKDRFLAQWKQISEFFKDYPDSLLFEILNEPRGNLTAAKWNVYAADALAKIREDNPRRTVLIGTRLGTALGSLELPDDKNIILTHHYYKPFEFTHQGESWGGDPTGAWLGTEWWDTEPEREMILRDFAPLKALEEQQHIPVHIGEFGTTTNADPVSREKFASFLSCYFDALGWSWAYWQFNVSNFGCLDPSSERYNQYLVDALLLNGMPEPTPYVGIPLYTSNFESGNDGWNLLTSGGASAQLTRSDNALNISINNGGTLGWHVQIRKQNITLDAGKKYHFSFRAKASAIRNVSAIIRTNTSPYTPYSVDGVVTLADNFTVYNFVFDMRTADNSAMMTIDMGGVQGTNVTITDIKIEEMTI